MVQNSLLYVAAAAAAGLLSSANGLSLRQHMENDLAANAKSSATSFSKTMGMAKANRCQPEKPGAEERMCEPSTSVAVKGQATCTDCAQICHVWGDPHMAVFSTDSTVNVFSKPGEYVMWNFPGDKQDIALDFRVQVAHQQSAIGLKPWIVSASLNGEVLLTVDDCKADGNNNAQDTIVMSSDARRAANAQDVDIMYYFGCRRKHNVWALEAWIKVTDDNSPEHANIASELQPYSLSTRMLAKDTGACVAWLTDGRKETFPTPEAEAEAHIKSLANDFNNQRTSDIKTSAGRQCKCSAECAVWGDPYVNDIFSPATRSAKKNFQIPKSDVITQSQRILYSSTNKYAVGVEMNDCEFITRVYVYIIKPECLSKMESCNLGTATSTDFLDNTCYEKFVIDAETSCVGAGTFSKKNRKKIQVPSDFADYGEDYYTPSVNGYSLGLGVLNDAGVLVPVNPSKPEKCAQQLGLGSSDTFVDLGAVRTIMKCHKSVEGIPYFNVCMQREGLSTADGQGTQTTANVATMELQSRSAGWCATGDFTEGGQAATMEASTFTHRAAGQTSTFPLAADTQ
jgi:hypothetical protein